MSLHLPRPYPDELMGSMLHRAARQLGVGRRLLLTRLSGHNISTHSTVTTQHEGIARAFGFSLEEFLDKHTLQKYMVAYMPAEKDQAQSIAKPVGTIPHSRYIKLGSQWLKLCPLCVQHDLQQYGESYWHRVHQLRAVDVCVLHHIDLLVSTQLIRREGNWLPPHEVSSTAFKTSPEISTPLRYAISHVSAQVLWGDTQQDWIQTYKQHAKTLGYLHRVSAIHSRQFAHDMAMFFGQPFLREHDCEIQINAKGGWPSKLLTASSSHTATFKHILINVFLNSQIPTGPGKSR